MKPIKKIFRIHPEGLGFAGLGLLIACGLTLIHPYLGMIGFIIAAWIVYFFRDPLRITPQRAAVISAGDGIVVGVQEGVKLPSEIIGEAVSWTRVSVFLDIFDVHINRVPVTGIIEKVYYHPGKFLNASFDKASDLNERNSLLIKAENGQKFVCTQIAGLIARRIRCDVKPGDHVKQGEKYGLIRFGSRMDLYLPAGLIPLVEVGQRMIGGETVIAELS